MEKENKTIEKPKDYNPPKEGSSLYAGNSRVPTASSRFDERATEFESKLLDLARVTRVTAGGKQLRFRAVVIIGNKAGKIGLGVAKGIDVSQAVEKATRLARKNIVNIQIVRGTIPHETESKFGPAKILLKPQREGKGLIAGGVVRAICTLAGIKNISSKVLGTTTNKLNNAGATLSALSKLKMKQRTMKR